MMKIRIGLIDSCHLTRKLLKEKIFSQQEQGFDVVLELNSLSELTDLNPLKNAPDIVFLDIDLPGMNGVYGIPILLEYFPDCRIILFTDTENMESVAKAVGIGASGYLKKDADPTELIFAIQSIFNDQVYISPAIIKWKLDNTRSI